MYSPLIFAVGAGANCASHGASATTNIATLNAISESESTRLINGRQTLPTISARAMDPSSFTTGGPSSSDVCNSFKQYLRASINPWHRGSGASVSSAGLSLSNSFSASFVIVGMTLKEVNRPSRRPSRSPNRSHKEQTNVEHAREAASLGGGEEVLTGDEKLSVREPVDADVSV